ncbi:MAG: amidase [Alphaproteobacteria bacterium]|nr:amidase [Alphaproteobacteria bacterium]
MTEACELSAVAARRLIGQRKLSPVELLDSCLRRIDRVNPAVNAVVAMAADRARDEARKAEQAVMAGQKLGVLHGLPLGVKDLEDTEGLRTTYGSLIFKDNVPAKDERGTAVLRAAGAIVVGKTNTPEFGAGANTTNKVYGPSRNPFDPTRTCAGSSGGSAVALATGMFPICTGSDTGGSLRNPAAFCGVVGFRTSPGLVPNERRPLGWTNLSVRGPMGRTVADACLLLSAQAGFDARDPHSRPVDPSIFREPAPVDLSSLRVGYTADFGGHVRIDQRIRQTFEDRIRRIAPVFKSCAETKPDFAGGDEVFEVIRAQNFLAGHLEKYRTKKDLLGPNVTANVEQGLTMTGEDVSRAHVRQTQIFRAFQALFQDIDVLVCPPVAVPPFPVEQLYVGEINGETLRTYFHWLAPAYMITLTGNPAIAIPCGLEPTGTPMSLQIVGPHCGDKFVTSVAHALEQHLAGDPATARPVPDLTKLKGK